VVAIALFAAACGATVPPSPTPRPIVTPTPATPAPSSPPFRAAAYPVAGDAPCGQTKPPDATHAAYTGDFKRISAKDPSTVVFSLCAPDVAFLSKIAAPAFAINDAGWLEAHIGPAGGTDQPIVSAVNGTGPYRLERWDRGSEISLTQNDTYWGEPAKNERVIVRWDERSAQRVSELQGATVDGIDDIAPADVAAIGDDVGLQLLPRPGLETFYMGLSGAGQFGDERVRRALAMGIDRDKLTESFFPPGSVVASQYTPCAIPNGCAGIPWYEFDPLQAKELLAASGLQDGFDTTIHYPDAPTAGVPDPAGFAAALGGQLLDNLAIRTTLVAEPAATYQAALGAGKLDGIHLSSGGASYPDVSAYLDPQFGPGASKAFGKPFADIGRALASGRATTNAAQRTAAYKKANDLIRAHAPMIPIAVAASSAAFRADVDGAGVSPLRLERFADMVPGDRRQLVWVTSSEPPGLYCADETDPVAGLVCAQLTDGLYRFDPAGAAPIPALASSCTPNAAATVWTCNLRTGVRFHDGATLDAGDVVTSFAAQWDADHPLHAGHDGTFAQFAASFGGFLHAPAASP
jgi:peptide/nickel transport system substrate-binding protein